MVIRANQEEDKALRVFLDTMRNREKQGEGGSGGKDDVRVLMFPDGADYMVMLETKRSGGIFAEMASKHRDAALSQVQLVLRRCAWEKKCHVYYVLNDQKGRT